MPLNRCGLASGRGTGVDSSPVSGVLRPDVHPQHGGGAVGALRPKREVLIDTAIALLQRENFSAIGLRELAQSAGTQTASLYTHFDSKDDLAFHAMRHYASWYRRELLALSMQGSGSNRIERYIEMLADMLTRNGSLCLGLMLISARNALTASVMGEVKHFSDESINWLASAWAAGLSDGSVTPRLMPDQAARLVFSSFQGIMALSVTQLDPEIYFRSQACALVAALGLRRLESHPCAHIERV